MGKWLLLARMRYFVCNRSSQSEIASWKLIRQEDQKNSPKQVYQDPKANYLARAVIAKLSQKTTCWMHFPLGQLVVLMYEYDQYPLRWTKTERIQSNRIAFFKGIFGYRILYHCNCNCPQVLAQVVFQNFVFIN